MFADIPKEILSRMAQLERIDSLDRTDHTPRLKRLRQIPPEVGKFIAILAAGTPAGRWVEIGTSAGYSTLWLALACRAVGRKITTYEILEEKAELARQTFETTCGASAWGAGSLRHARTQPLRYSSGLEATAGQ